MKRVATISSILSLIVVLAIGFHKWHRKSKACDNQAYCFPAENNGWNKYGKVPVYGDDKTGTMFDPFVTIQHDSLVMVVSERKTGNIIRLSSFDGIHWIKTNTMLYCRPSTWEHLVNRACILNADTIWHMWYTGQSPDVSQIGHATSKDGYTFKRDSIAVLKPTLEEEGISVMNPCVLYNKRKKCLQMWYAAGENIEPDALFYAESSDGKHWRKRTNPVLEKYPQHKWERAKVGGCQVLQNINGKGYKMYYIGYQDINTARICFATSKDGIDWERPDNNLILSPSKGAWDSEATYKPTYIKWRGKEMLWYNGRTDIREYIGLATK